LTKVEIFSTINPVPLLGVWNMASLVCVLHFIVQARVVCKLDFFSLYVVQLWLV